jgi:arsenate reductase-like glutaredoxin family protein
MFKKTGLAAITLLVIVMLATAPLMIYAQVQSQTLQAEKLVELAEKAGQQVQNLIDMIETDNEALNKIEESDLTEEYAAKVSLYKNEGLVNLVAAQDALAESNYEEAVDYGLEAFKVFKEVYSSIHVIIEAAGIQKGNLIENQGLPEAITRELERIKRLRDILTEETPEEIETLLNEAEELLKEAGTLLLQGEAAEAKLKFVEARQNISEVYQFLKAQAEDYNLERFFKYCERVRERIRERFRHAREQNVDLTDVLQKFGYQSENQFMETLEKRIHSAQDQQDFSAALQACEGINQMVQEMEQALNQEISKHQGQHGTGGSGFGGRVGS